MIDLQGGIIGHVFDFDLVVDGLGRHFGFRVVGSRVDVSGSEELMVLQRWDGAITQSGGDGISYKGVVLGQQGWRNFYPRQST